MEAKEDQSTGQSQNISSSLKPVMLIQFFVITVIIITVVFTYLGAFPFDSDLGIYRILPGDILIDFIWLYIISGVLGLVLYFISSMLSSFMLRIHRAFIGRNSRYYSQDIVPNVTIGSQIRRLLLPAFTTLGISYSIVNMDSIVNVILVTESFTGTDINVQAQSISIGLSLLFMLLLMVNFIMILFVPIWTLQDAGLVRESEQKTGVISETEGVGSWYLKLVKGFAGISTLVAYIFTILQTIDWYQYLIEHPPEEGFSLLVFLVPVAAILAAPILALGPISVVYLFYVKSKLRNSARFKVHLQ
ncbi:MAG: hypothetical protein ACTSR9_08310 [Candidatus Thorarchaeota archaeon]